MCGITGIYSSKRSTELIRSIKLMTDSLQHRGPDDEGYYCVDFAGGRYNLSGKDSKVEGLRIDEFNTDVNLCLGHRRLSILDVSPLGHQPMGNKDGTLWIVFNGEIYNYLELREELKEKGYCFYSDSDTEVLLAAYQEWGDKCLDKFNGMWSFVIYDVAKNILFGSRDRFGVKPFYYYRGQGLFVFASEIKALLKTQYVKKELNRKAVYDYLSYGAQEIEEEGFFKGIFELPPASAFKYALESGEFEKYNYYTLSYAEQWKDFDQTVLDQNVKTLKDDVFNAVKLRLRSDVPVGSCLSGGLDSSTIVCTINELLKHEPVIQVGQRQQVFTASYDSDRVDESKWAKLVVDKTQTSWHRTFPKAKDLLNDLEDLVYYQDIPFGSTSIYAQYRVMKQAQETGIKVLLDGQGGDELFTGYTVFYRMFFAEMIKKLRFIDLGREFSNLNNSPISKTTAILMLLKLYGSMLLPLGLKHRVYQSLNKQNEYLTSGFTDKYEQKSNPVLIKSKHSLNVMMWEMTSNNLKNLLKYEDRNSMRFSIESRTPFADDITLVENVFNIPSVYKIHKGWSKFLLREVVKGLVPEPIRMRTDKLGFSTPERDWLKELKEDLRSYITGDLSEFINVEKLKHDWDHVFEEPLNPSIWRIINFAVWKKVYSI